MKRGIDILFLCMILFCFSIVIYGAERNSIYNSFAEDGEEIVEMETCDNGILIISNNTVSKIIAPPEEKWAISNLIFTLSTIIMAIVLMFAKIKPREDKNYNIKAYKEDKRDLRYFKEIAIMLAAVSLVFFLFTEDITLKMQLIDRWTIVSFIIFTDQLYASIMIKRNARGSQRDRQWRD